MYPDINVQDVINKGLFWCERKKEYTMLILFL